MKAVYVHIPFCKSICSYCDFPKFLMRKDWAKAYLDELEKEIKENYHCEKIKTLYIGGGTPSALDMEDLERLFEILRIFDLGECEEFTIECNIEDIEKEKVCFFKNMGVNRLSIGVQTFHEKYLKLLNRQYTRQEVIDKIELIKAYGMLNFNIDLMYALPGETVEEVKEDVLECIKLNVPHISTYSLMIEPHTVLGINKVEPIDEDLDYEMYQAIETLLKDYHHYEISNYSAYTFESKHNLTYWNNLEYYGFGLGAAGYIDGVRYENTKNWNQYLNGKKRMESHKLSMNETIENELILGLRKLEGISLSEFKEKYQKSLKDYPVIQELLTEGKLKIEKGNIKIKKEYLYVSNQILYRLIGEEYE